MNCKICGNAHLRWNGFIWLCLRCGQGQYGYAAPAAVEETAPEQLAQVEAPAAAPAALEGNQVEQLAPALEEAAPAPAAPVEAAAPAPAAPARGRGR